MFTNVWKHCWNENVCSSSQGFHLSSALVFSFWTEGGSEKTKTENGKACLDKHPTDVALLWHHWSPWQPCWPAIACSSSGCSGVMKTRTHLHPCTHKQAHFSLRMGSQHIFIEMEGLTSPPAQLTPQALPESTRIWTETLPPLLKALVTQVYT